MSGEDYSFCEKPASNLPVEWVRRNIVKYYNPPNNRCVYWLYYYGIPQLNMYLFDPEFFDCKEAFERLSDSIERNYFNVANSVLSNSYRHLIMREQLFIHQYCHSFIDKMKVKYGEFLGDQFHFIDSGRDFLYLMTDDQRNDSRRRIWPSISISFHNCNHITTQFCNILINLYCRNDKIYLRCLSSAFWSCFFFLDDFGHRMSDIDYGNFNYKDDNGRSYYNNLKHAIYFLKYKNDQTKQERHPIRQEKGNKP